MTRITVARTIDPPIDLVFQTVADIRQLSKALPHVVNFEFLSDVQSGVGTRFRETRLMKGKEATTELEVTEFVENDRIRLLADSHGTIWDTVFAVKPASGRTVLTLTMDAKAYRLIAAIMNSLISGMIKKGVERDMDLVKAFCER